MRNPDDNAEGPIGAIVGRIRAAPGRAIVGGILGGFFLVSGFYDLRGANGGFFGGMVGVLAGGAVSGIVSAIIDDVFR